MSTNPSSVGSLIDATVTGETTLTYHYADTAQRATRIVFSLDSKTGSGSQRPIMSIGNNAPDYNNFCPSVNLDALQNINDVVDYIVPQNNPLIDTQLADVVVKVTQATIGYSDFKVYVEMDGTFKI